VYLKKFSSFFKKVKTCFFFGGGRRGKMIHIMRLIEVMDQKEKVVQPPCRGPLENTTSQIFLLFFFFLEIFHILSDGGLPEGGWVTKVRAAKKGGS